MKKVRIILYFILVIFFFAFNYYFRPVEGNPMVDDAYRNSSSYLNDLYKSDEYFKNNVLSTDEDLEAYDMILHRRSIKCSSEDDDCIHPSSDVYYAVWLDHPEQIYKAHSVLDGRILTYLGTKRIEREIDFVRKDTKNMSDKEKILYVYNYVASHDYDYVYMSSQDNQSPYSFFTKGTSVCAGFAKASQILFQNIGIKSYLVLGEDHMWNYVEYEGKYYIFDATVGASHHDKSLDIYYEGLCRTTVGATTGFYEELYPKIEKQCLRDIFDV